MTSHCSSWTLQDLVLISPLQPHLSPPSSAICSGLSVYSDVVPMAWNALFLPSLFYQSFFFFPESQIEACNLVTSLSPFLIFFHVREPSVVRSTLCLNARNVFLLCITVVYMLDLFFGHF